MGKEQEADGDIVSLRQHFEGLLAAHQRLDDERHTDLDRRFAQVVVSAQLVAAASDEKFRGTNEWRQAMQDRENTFARKDRLEALEGSFNQLQISFANLSGRASQSSVILSYLLGIAGLLIGLAGLLRH